MHTQEGGKFKRAKNSLVGLYKCNYLYFCGAGNATSTREAHCNEVQHRALRYGWLQFSTYFVARIMFYHHRHYLANVLRITWLYGYTAYSNSKASSQVLVLFYLLHSLLSSFTTGTRSRSSSTRNAITTALQSTALSSFLFMP